MTLASKVRYLFLALGTAAFAYFVYRVGVGVIVRNVRDMGFWFLAVLAVWAAGYLLNTASYSLILGPARHEVGYVRLLGTVVAGFAMNYATPFLHMGGEPFRLAVLRERIGGARAAFATISYKVANAMSSLSYWTIGALLVLVSGRVPLLVGLVILAVPAGILGVFVLLVRGHSGEIFASLQGMTGRWRLLAPFHRVLVRHERALSEVDKHFRDLREQRPKAFWGALLIETAVRVLLACELYIILYSLGRPVSFISVMAMDAAATLILNASFFIPFELGAREGGMYMILSSSGMPADIGIFVALVNRIRELFWIGVGLAWGHFLAARTKTVGPAPTVANAEADGDGDRDRDRDDALAGVSAAHES